MKQVYINYYIYSIDEKGMLYRVEKLYGGYKYEEYDTEEEALQAISEANDFGENIILKVARALNY